MASTPACDKPPLDISSEHRLRSENLAFDIDVWYPRLVGLTPRSTFMPLSRAEALAIVHFQSTRYLGRQTLCSDDVWILRELEHRIHAHICAEFPEGAMIRLCGRSPKDGDPLDRTTVWVRYMHELQLLLDCGENLSVATKLRALARVSYLKVSSGREAMSLLLSSERVFADCRDRLDYGEPDQVVLREWISEMVLDYEFRAFVNNGRIIAISQYDHYGVYPDLLPMKQKIEQLIFACWREVHPRIDELRYVIDFAYLPHTQRLVVIELSPFLRCTGPALFRWNDDGTDILREGEYEFRLNNRIAEGLDDIIETNWEDRWASPTLTYEEYLQTTGLCTPALPAPALPVRAIMYGAMAVGLAAIFFGRKVPPLGGVLAAVSIATVQALLCKHDLPLEAPIPGSPPKSVTLFAYGTLKRGFHWHAKFLSSSSFVGDARTAHTYPLVVGACGVPYLLFEQNRGYHVHGEVFTVDAETLQGLDEYEGVGKGYYDRIPIEVLLSCGRMVTADAYFMVRPTEALRSAEMIPEYTLAYHQEYYNPIRHVRVKQERYLGDVGSYDRT